MKAVELRIGNYLSLPTRNADIVIIEEILRDDFIVCNLTTNEWPISDYAPIPLTEEWLLKFGFEQRKIKYQRGRHIDYLKYIQSKRTKPDRIIIVFSYDKYYYQGDCFPTVNYVHQLQNLYFALTGNELEIKP
jgi:hypothetical protein